MDLIQGPGVQKGGLCANRIVILNDVKDNNPGVGVRQLALTRSIERDGESCGKTARYRQANRKNERENGGWGGGEINDR